MKHLITLLLSSLLLRLLPAQCPGGLTLTADWFVDYYSLQTPLISPLSMRPDALGRPYLYVASNELGVRVYDVAASPTLTASLDTVALEMRVSNLTQVDSLLFVSLGSIFDNGDPPGMAIVDISDPTQPLVRDVWIDTIPSGTGAGITQVEGQTAYLGAMGEGLILLDISDPDNIQYINRFNPPTTYPVVNNNPDFVNARGMHVRDSIVFLAQDANGLRVIDCHDPNAIVEIGAYANPITFPGGIAQHRAYNNILARDTLLYVAVDYCGLELISVADPSNPRLVSSWNPHNCPTGSWLSSAVHTNEMALREDCGLLFLSTGKSEMIVLDVRDPLHIDSCLMYGSVSDTTGTWGIAMTDDRIYLSYILAVLPFGSTIRGIQSLDYTVNCALGIDPSRHPTLACSPNPAAARLSVGIPSAGTLRIFSMSGALVHQRVYASAQQAAIDLSTWPLGLYSVHFHNQYGQMTRKIMVTR